ncbi:MAG: helix-turn-helix transcriptional regulator [Anaerotignum sp.]|nr:helix-turn-helix transcriptional regulator [Anaerotignum sp.]
MILADKIIENRKKNGWSQEELAEKLGVSRQSVSKWESTQAIPDMKKILHLSELFGVSTDYLLKDDIGEEVVPTTDTIDYGQENNLTVRVSMEQANSFLDYNEKAASPVSIGVMLCIISSVPLLILLGLSETERLPFSEYIGTMLGMIILLIMIACAVTIFIFTTMKGKAFKYLEEQNIDTDYGVNGMAKEGRSKYEGIHTRSMVIGVVLCIVSAIPLFITMITEYTSAKLGGALVLYGVAALLTLIGVGVKILVKTSMIQNGFNKLLEEGDYTRLNKRASRWDGIYWSIVVAVYLGWSFMSGRWNFTWIVWPIAGVTFVGYKEIIKTVIRAKNK